MTHATCPDCRLRFTPAAAAYLPACPTCGGPLQPLNRPDGAVGFRLFAPNDAPDSLAQAIALAMPTPTPPTRQS